MHSLHRTVLLGYLLLAAACRSAEQHSILQSDEAALFAASDKILRGKLTVVSLHPDLANIKVGESLAYVGGDGKEIPPDTQDRLRQLQGVDVIAGVHDYSFHFGPVLVVMCSSWKVALGPESQFSDTVAACETLRAQRDWHDSACRLESGEWERLLLSLKHSHHDTTDELLATFLRSAPERDIARDVAGWYARMTGKEVDMWPHGEVRVGEDTIQTGDVRDVAKRVLERTLRLPEGFLTFWYWDALEESRRIWILTEMRTRD